MNLQHRIDLLIRLGQYILSGDDLWEEVKENAGRENGWFIPEFVQLATENIARSFLQKNQLENWVTRYPLLQAEASGQNLSSPRQLPPKVVGIVMAGNIPLVGFHDFLCVFISGHKALIKPSSKDEVLIKHLTQKLEEWSSEKLSEELALNSLVAYSAMLKNCDAYIATGSNNSSRYFDYYFKNYKHIIRRNKTSVAILTGEETKEDLEKLADDVYLYFGLGCRNVTKIYVPTDYDFIPLLEAFRKYNYLADHHKYKNNYDYNLALHLLNKKYYMTNGSILLIEDSAIFSPISQLNYEFYSDNDDLAARLPAAQDLQCVVGKSFIPFGKGQSPSIIDYADGIDTLEFVSAL